VPDKEGSLVPILAFRSCHVDERAFLNLFLFRGAFLTLGNCISRPNKSGEKNGFTLPFAKFQPKRRC
jgi:hypothetical protein